MIGTGMSTVFLSLSMQSITGVSKVISDYIPYVPHPHPADLMTISDSFQSRRF